MLKGIPEILPPILLKVLCEMGHGEEKIVIRMAGHQRSSRDSVI